MLIERGDDDVTGARCLPHDSQGTLQGTQQYDATYAGCGAKNEVFVKRQINTPGDRPVADGSSEFGELLHSPKVRSSKG